MRWGLSGTISPHPSLSSNLTPNVFMPVFFASFPGNIFCWQTLSRGGHVGAINQGCDIPSPDRAGSQQFHVGRSEKTSDQSRSRAAPGCLAGHSLAPGRAVQGRKISILDKKKGKTLLNCYLGSLCAQSYLCNNL